MQPVRVRLGWCVAAIAVAGPALGTTSTDAGAAGTAADSGDAGPAKPATTPPVTLEEIVVATNRYEATDLQLKAPNAVSVLSAEDLANTAVHNAAEALGLLPAVNVMNTSTGSFIGGIDSAARAEGMFTSIRGMNAEFNVNLVNGVNVAQGMPYSREVQLSLLPPSGLKTVVLNKTSLADMDGDAIGGTVDFRTPTAFDFTQPFTSVTAGARLESRPLDYGNNGLGYNFGAEIARRFGSDQQFGLYFGGYYNLRHFVNSEMGGVMESGCCDNGWNFKVGVFDPVKNMVVSPPGIDPAQNIELTAFNVGTSSGFTKQFGGSTAFDWRPDETTTAYAHLTYAYALTQQDSNLSQIVAMNVLTAGTTPLSPFQTPQGYYQPDLQNVSIRYWLETNPEVAELGTFQVGVDKKIGTWTFSPNLFYSWGRDDRPNHIEIDTRTSHVQGGDITDNGFPYGQTSLVTYANGGFPYANLTPEMTAQLYNIRGLPAFDRGELQKGYSGQKKGGAKFDVRKELSELLELRFGVKYMTSSRKVTFNDWTNPGFFDGSTFGSLPIWNGDYKPVFPGKYGWSVPKIDEDKLLAYYGSAADAVKYLDTCGSVVDSASYQNSLHCDDQMATEDVSAAYAMVQLHPGDFEITPGLRFEHTYIHNKFWIPFGFNNLTPGFNTNRTIYNEALPSLFVNYRPDPLTVYRAGIWKSYTKPAYVKLGGGISVTPENSGGGAAQLMQGNPGLKPIEAVNYDLSGEWDNGNGRHIMLGGFFKTLKDYYYDSIVSQTATNNSGGGYVLKEPVNAGSGQVWGVEFGARQKFTFLPAPFDGFGISGNATREHTLVHLNVTGFDPSSPIENAPDWLANVEFFYDKGGLNVGLLYNYNGKYLSQYDPLSQGSNWDDLWVRPVWRLDMHAGYAFESGLKLDLSVSNLTRNYTYWSHLTKNSLVVSDIVDSGLTGFFNVTYKF